MATPVLHLRHIYYYTPCSLPTVMLMKCDHKKVTYSFQLFQEEGHFTTCEISCEYYAKQKRRQQYLKKKPDNINNILKRMAKPNCFTNFPLKVNSKI